MFGNNSVILNQQSFDALSLLSRQDRFVPLEVVQKCPSLLIVSSLVQFLLLPEFGDFVIDPVLNRVER